MIALRCNVVSFDIDGTLTIGHGWFYIASSSGRLDSYIESTSAFRAGMIGEDEHLANLLNIAAGLPLDSVEKMLEDTPRLENIASGIRYLKDRGFRTYLLTHNPDYVCRWYAEKYGMDGFRCARQSVRNGIICRAHGVHADKVGWLNEMCRRESVPRSSVVHVGDGLSDADVFGIAGMGIALNTRIRGAIRRADASINTTDMMDVVRTIADMCSEG